jgi:Peptidase family M28
MAPWGDPKTARPENEERLMNDFPSSTDRSFRLTLIALGVLLLVLAFWPCGAGQGPSSPLGPVSPRTGLLLTDRAIVRLIGASSGDLALDHVSQLARWHRIQASDGYARAAEWTAGKAGEFGLENVSIERFPSDGKTEYFGYRTPPRWAARKGELWLVAPFPMKIASYAEMPLSLVEGSTTADIEAELVDVGAGTSDKDYAAGVKGKIVLTTSKVQTVFGRAVGKEGAAGVISSWSVPDFDYLNRHPGDFPDQVGWMEIPAGEAEGSARIAFAVSARRAEELRILIGQGRPVRVRAVVEAEMTPGHLEVVSGVIPGSAYPDEEMLVTAHLDHYQPGANDNASGSAAILEMARTLRRLIDDKEMPPPLRTVRFLWVPEYYGSCAWLAKHLQDPVRRIADLNFDMVGENAAKTNAVVAACYTSDSNPSFLNAVVESVLDFVNRFNDDRYPVQRDLYIGSVGGTRNRAAWRMIPFISGSDHDLFNALKTGATTLTSWPDDFYHSSEDTVDKVDPTQLHRAVVMGLAAVTTLAYADSVTARDLARLALAYGRKRIAQSEFAAIQSLLGVSKEDFGEADRSAANKIKHLFARERAAVGSCAVFAREPAAKSDIQWALSALESDEAASRKRVEEAAKLRAAELGVARKPLPSAEAEKHAARSVPAWNAGKELFPYDFVQRTLAKDPAARMKDIEAAFEEAGGRLREQGVDELTLYGIRSAPALYADGKRSILEIRDALAAEYTTVPLEALELYFKAFEKAGLMKVTAK